MEYWLGTVRKTQIGDFTCAHCGWKGRARLTGVGAGTTLSTAQPAEVALDAAERDAVRDAARQLRRVRCRKCGQRPNGAALGFALPYALLALPFLWLGWVVWPFIGFPIALVAIPLYAWQEWRRIDGRIEWLPGEAAGRPPDRSLRRHPASDRFPHL
jgi:hypothetical protein